ncbi:General transcription factor 3C polypeptide 2, partial [Fragariocoptes setiger]
MTSDSDDPIALRRAKGREGNREQAKKTRLLKYWHESWEMPELRKGSPYPARKALSMLQKAKKIKCPQCDAQFTTRQGIQYHFKRCNIDLKPKCLLCQLSFPTKGMLLRHLCTNHISELPDPPNHLIEGLDYLFDIESAKRTQRARSSVGVHNPLILAKKFHSEYFNAKGHFLDKWLPTKKCWSLVDQKAANITMLPQSSSPKFKLNDSEWIALEAGQSLCCTGKHCSESLIDSSTDTIFYTGGSIWAAAWCPMPDCVISTPEQFIIVAVSCADMDATRTFRTNANEPGYLQLWSLTPVKRKSSPQGAKLKLSIFHRYGCIWGMSWCPGGTSFKESSSQIHNDSQMPRLGLLALACSDGRIRIISIPHVQSLEANFKSSWNFEEPPVFTVQTVAELVAPGIGSSTDYHAIVCKCLSWSDTNPSLIAAGYSNGLIAVFDIESTSQLLITNQDTRQIIRPLKVWFAHNMAVTSLTWMSSTNVNSLASGSVDRSIKVWNLDDLISFLSLEKFPVTKIMYDYRHKGCIIAFDTAFNSSFTNRVITRHPTREGWEGRSLTLHRGTVWDFDISPITSSFASVDSAGELIVLPMFSTKKVRSNKNLQIHNRLSIYSIIPSALEDQIDTSQNERTDSDTESDDSDESSEGAIVNHDSFTNPKKYKSIETRKSKRPKKFLLPHNYPPVDSYEHFKRTFGLTFKDSSESTSEMNIELLNCDRVCDYPFCSINKTLAGL